MIFNKTELVKEKLYRPINKIIAFNPFTKLLLQSLLNGKIERDFNFLPAISVIFALAEIIWLISKLHTPPAFGLINISELDGSGVGGIFP